MKAELRYLGKSLQFQGTTESKLRQLIDDVKNEPNPIGPSPMELVLQAAAGCTAMDVVSILNKMRRQITDLRVMVDSERRDQHPRIFTKIHLFFLLSSPDATEAELEKAVQLSQEKYCSVAGMLRSTVNMTYSWELRRP